MQLNFWEKKLDKPWCEIHQELTTRIQKSNEEFIKRPCISGIKYLDMDIYFRRRFDLIDKKNTYIRLDFGAIDNKLRTEYLYFGKYVDHVKTFVPVCFDDKDNFANANVGISIYNTKENTVIELGGQNSFDIFNWKDIIIDLYPEGIDPGGPHSAGVDYRLIFPYHEEK